MIACLAALLLAQGPSLVNGDFEAPSEGGAIPGWRLDFGARNGGAEPASRVTIDGGEKHGGRTSLRLSGDDKVRGWRSVSQEVEARPGGKYTLSVSTRTKDVRQETVAGTQVQQYANCYVALFVRAADGRIIGREYARATVPSADWEQLTARVTAPETAATVEVCAFLSMSGDLWVDDVALTVEGGRALPAPEVLVSEGFESATSLPKEWTEEIGATNAAAGERSRISIDAEVGEAGSPRSLRFSGEAATKKWYLVAREFDAHAGDVFRLAASFRTLDVRKEDIQFENLYVGLAFMGADGRNVGLPVYAMGPRGTSDWKRSEISAFAPDGATRARLMAFLSMSGDAWIDRIELTRRGGAAPAYGDWLTLDSEHVIVRFPKDHPQRAGLRAYAQRLDAAYESIRKALAVPFDGKITVFLYDSKEQGRRFTGRALAFADADAKAVHQTTENTLGHEMTHVIARAIGYAQAPLFGEGLAVWLDGSPDEMHHARAATMLREGKLPSLETLLQHFREDEAATYPAAGSFTGFVIQTSGLEALKRIYVAPDPLAAAPEMLGKSLAELDLLWRESLRNRK